MKILFHYDAGPRLRETLMALEDETTQIMCVPEGPLEPLVSALGDVDVVWHVLQPLTADILRHAPRLKLIQKIGVGVNTIDLDYARAHEIAVCNMPGTNSQAVAEMTLLLMLSCVRQLPTIDQNLRSGRWMQDQQINETLREVTGLTIGLLGFGATPQVLAPILTAMGATVIYANRNEKNVPYERVSMDALLARSDIVSLHLPLTQETEHCINAQALAKMKRGAVLVNTARGGLVDEGALLAALQSGHLGGAGLDVFADEPTPSDHPLFRLPTVTVTPHIAWLTQQTWSRSLTIAMENARATVTGQGLRHRVV